MATVVGTITAVYVVGQLVADLGARRGPDVVWALAAASCAPVALLIAVRSLIGNELWLPRPLVPVVVVLFGVLLSAQSGAAQYENGTVAEYCKYGAVSQAQLDHCRRTVDEAYVEGLQTNAARFARRELETCGADAGPFCDQVVISRSWADQQPGQFE